MSTNVTTDSIERRLSNRFEIGGVIGRNEPSTIELLRDARKREENLIWSEMSKNKLEDFNGTTKHPLARMWSALLLCHRKDSSALLSTTTVVTTFSLRKSESSDSGRDVSIKALYIAMNKSFIFGDVIWIPLSSGQSKENLVHLTRIITFICRFIRLPNSSKWQTIDHYHSMNRR